MWFLGKRTAWLRRGAACALLWASLSAQVQDAAPTEYEVKAAFLYNFGRFVAWPPQPRPPSAFAICVLGKDPFGPVLDDLIKDKSIQGMKLVARRLERVEDAGACRILFISASEDAQLAHILAALRGRSVLTVGEAERFAHRGGMINFRLEGSKVRFDINPDAAEQAGLTISSQLLKLARIVHESPQPGV
jgi:hypothetical protein